MEPKSGFEPETSSLPRMRSTPELFGLKFNNVNCLSKLWSGRRDSNSQHSAWKADALPLSYSRDPILYLRFWIDEQIKELIDSQYPKIQNIKSKWCMG